MKTSQERLREYYSDSENKSNSIISETENSDKISQQSTINSLFSYPSLDDENIMLKPCLLKKP